MNDQGFIIVDNKCATNMRNVWAIGDISDSGEMLAHVASNQGEMVAEIIAGHIREYDPVSVPAIVFTEPEIISVGMSPEEGKEYCEKLNTTLLTGKFPLAANVEGVQSLSHCFRHFFLNIVPLMLATLH